MGEENTQCVTGDFFEKRITPGIIQRKCVYKQNIKEGKHTIISIPYDIPNTFITVYWIIDPNQEQAGARQDYSKNRDEVSLWLFYGKNRIQQIIWQCFPANLYGTVFLLAASSIPQKTKSFNPQNEIICWRLSTNDLFNREVCSNIKLNETRANVYYI